MRYFFSTELIKSAIEDIESRKSHELVILYLATIVEKKIILMKEHMTLMKCMKQ